MLHKTKNKSVIFSPAKINLFFQVLGKRVDGYHDIASIYQTIDIGDFLYFRFAKKDCCTATSATIPLDETNLVIQAIKQFRKKCLFLPQLHVHIVKNIPQQAGLGGASSNAACALWWMNNLMGSIFSIEELSKIGEKIGSDVPFFFSSGFAYCTGKGSVVENLKASFSESLFLATPDYFLSTPEVYKQVKIPKKPIQAFSAKQFLRNPRFFNDLEKAAFLVEPKLRLFKEYLQTLFSHVCMTGSGACFFCLGNRVDISDPRIKKISFVRKSSHHWYQPIS